ncbi:hypothetical protein Golob_020009 [Gossypium lobatum]|uniref:Zinc knuckle CX2CX4HX4C domain-containing protein n=1 Tax=Gossypium lobatum TaxID=34289 RepID=A0A7J8L969_9ROSI|nr:hypothetical protein [Gossypium lobatum]
MYTFARLAVYIDLGKFLVSKLQMDGIVQRVEYESMSLLYFGCRRFGHSCDACLHRSSNKDAIAHDSDKEDQFGPWMLVERKSRQRPLTATKEIVDSIDARAEGSRFSVLSKNYDEVEGIKCTALNGSTGIKGSDGVILGKVLPARGKLLSNLQIKYKVLKKKSSKNKGKAIVLVNGQKLIQMF